MDKAMRFAVKQSGNGVVVYDVHYNVAYSASAEALKSPFYFTSQKIIVDDLIDIKSGELKQLAGDHCEPMTSIDTEIEGGYQCNKHSHYIVHVGENRNTVICVYDEEKPSVEAIISNVYSLLIKENPTKLLIHRGEVHKTVEVVEVAEDVVEEKVEDEVIETITSDIADLKIDVSRYSGDLHVPYLATIYTSDTFDIIECKILNDDNGGVKTQVSESSIVHSDDDFTCKIINPWGDNIAVLYSNESGKEITDAEIVSHIHEVFEYDPSYVETIYIVIVDAMSVSPDDIVNMDDMYYCAEYDEGTAPLYNQSELISVTINTSDEGATYSIEGGSQDIELDGEVYIHKGIVHNTGDGEYVASDVVESKTQDGVLYIFIKDVDHEDIGGLIINELYRYRDQNITGNDLIIFIGVDPESDFGLTIMEKEMEQNKVQSNQWTLDINGSEISFEVGGKEWPNTGSYSVEDIFNTSYHQPTDGIKVVYEDTIEFGEMGGAGGSLSLVTLEGDGLPSNKWVCVTVDGSLEQPVFVYIAPAVSFDERVDMSNFDHQLVWSITPRSVWYENGLDIDGENITFVVDDYANKAVLNSLTIPLGYKRDGSWNEYFSRSEVAKSEDEVVAPEEVASETVVEEVVTGEHPVSEEEFFSKEDTVECDYVPEPKDTDAESDVLFLPETSTVDDVLTLPLDDAMSILNLTGEVIDTELPVHSVDPKSITHEDFITLLRAFGGLGVIIDGRRSFKETVRKIDIVRAFNRHHVANLLIWILRDTGEDKYLEKIDSTPYHD